MKLNAYKCQNDFQVWPIIFITDGYGELSFGYWVICYWSKP
jgi:hypothetical protein